MKSIEDKLDVAFVFGLALFFVIVGIVYWEHTFYLIVALLFFGYLSYLLIRDIREDKKRGIGIRRHIPNPK